MADRSDPVEVIAAAHAGLVDAVEQLVSGDDYRRFLAMAASFHRYSAHNALLLAAQGASGAVASYRMWSTIPAVDGSTCQVRRGEQALRVLAPVHATRREVDIDTGEEVVVSTAVRRWRPAPVFHEGQLVSPPAWPAQPALLAGPHPIAEASVAVEALVVDAGFSLRYGPIPSLPGANGVTDWARREVVVRDDVEPAQAFKTLVHELGHVRLHDPDNPDTPPPRGVREVEAESVAFLVARALQLDTSSYSVPYVTHWAGGNTSVVQASAERALATARTIIERLEQVLDVDLVADPLGLVHARTEPVAPLRRPNPDPAPAADRLPPRGVTVERAPTRIATADDIVAEHLRGERVDWGRLRVELERFLPRADPSPMVAARAEMLADAGVSTPVAMEALHRGGYDPAEIVEAVTAEFTMVTGDERHSLFPVDEVHAATVAMRWYTPTHAATTASTTPVDTIESVERDAFARKLIASAGDVERVVVGIATYATNPTEAFRFAQHARNPVPLLSGLIERYQLPTATTASVLRAAHVPLEHAVGVMLTVTDPTDALVALRDAWPGHTDAQWIHLARQHRPEHELPAALPPTAGQPTAEDDSLITEWAAIQTRDTTNGATDLIDSWVAEATPAGHSAGTVSIVDADQSATWDHEPADAVRIALEAIAAHREMDFDTAAHHVAEIGKRPFADQLTAIETWLSFSVSLDGHDQLRDAVYNDFAPEAGALHRAFTNNDRTGAQLMWENLDRSTQSVALIDVFLLSTRLTPPPPTAQPPEVPGP